MHVLCRTFDANFRWISNGTKQILTVSSDESRNLPGASLQAQMSHPFSSFWLPCSQNIRQTGGHSGVGAEKKRITVVVKILAYNSHINRCMFYAGLLVLPLDGSQTAQSRFWLFQVTRVVTYQEHRYKRRCRSRFRLSGCRVRRTSCRRADIQALQLKVNTRIVKLRSTIQTNQNRLLLHADVESLVVLRMAANVSESGKI